MHAAGLSSDDPGVLHRQGVRPASIAESPGAGARSSSPSRSARTRLDGAGRQVFRIPRTRGAAGRRPQTSYRRSQRTTTGIPHPPAPGPHAPASMTAMVHPPLPAALVTITAGQPRGNYGMDAEVRAAVSTTCSADGAPQPYNVNRMLTGEDFHFHRHSNLVRAVAPHWLQRVRRARRAERLQVHGAENSAPQDTSCARARAGKVTILEFFAEIDLLCAGSTCPGGDLSVPLLGSRRARSDRRLPATRGRGLRPRPDPARRLEIAGIVAREGARYEVSAGPGWMSREAVCATRAGHAQGNQPDDEEDHAESDEVI